MRELISLRFSARYVKYMEKNYVQIRIELIAQDLKCLHFSVLSLSPNLG